MKITKLGHCCLLIEENGKVILTDPGAWTIAQNTITGIDIILITHEHADHFHIDSLKQILSNNPDATVVTNSRVHELLAGQGISAQILEHEQTKEVDTISIAGFGTEHATIYSAMPNIMNTGYLIANRLFYPGDAFTKPDAPIEILAMPMIGPWMKLSESIDWALALKPDVSFPVHDGMLQPRKWIYGLPSKVLPEHGVAFETAELSKVMTF